MGHLPPLLHGRNLSVGYEIVYFHVIGLEQMVPSSPGPVTSPIFVRAIKRSCHILILAQTPKTPPTTLHAHLNYFINVHKCWEHAPATQNNRIPQENQQFAAEYCEHVARKHLPPSRSGTRWFAAAAIGRSANHECAHWVGINQFV